MQFLNQIIYGVLGILLSFLGLNYVDNSKLSEQVPASKSELVAMQISVETEFQKYSAKVSADGVGECARKASTKRAKLKGWNFTIAP